ncbi:MAG: VOC family protein, partial [Candidatus Binataceae bacterium]
IDPTAPHVALDVEDLEAAKNRLKELGIEYIESAQAGAFIGNADTRLTGQQLWFVDPDGNTIELRTN